MPVAFVAEVSSNHHRDLDRCLAFIDTAAEIGCRAVKFQLFKVRELFAPEALEKREELRRREAWELPAEFLPKLAARCRASGIGFACTPFYLDAVEELRPHVDFYKIASYELLWKDLLRACARTGKPVVLSTGMADMGEIREAVQTLADAGCRDLTLLHCVSGYPVPPEECNLAAIETLRSSFRGSPCESFLKFGWSDHSVSPAVIHRAVHRWGAEMIEFHLDLEGGGDEFSAGHCWLPGRIRPVIQSVRVALRTDGTGEKVPAPSEREDREWRTDPVDGLRPLRGTREALKR